MQIKFLAAMIVAPVLTLAFIGCGGTATSATTTTSVSVGPSLNSVYIAVPWPKGVIVTFPTSCTATITSTGYPSPTGASAYYLEPTNNVGGPTVAVTPGSGIALGVAAFAASTMTTSFTVGTCPAKASSVTATGGGAIGMMLTGSALFNASEGANSTTPALSDNVSYSFTDSSNVKQTAYFIDACNGHPTPLTNTYHYHGNPPCVTALVDLPSGPSHIIGIAFDGFPIYGDRDATGVQVTLSQLDACNGITSATPEFPNGVYHYVLPVGVKTLRSSLSCYAGTPPSTIHASVVKYGVCDMMKMADGKMPSMPLLTVPASPTPPMRRAKTTALLTTVLVTRRNAVSTANRKTAADRKAS